MLVLLKKHFDGPFITFEMHKFQFIGAMLMQCKYKSDRVNQKFADGVEERIQQFSNLVISVTF